jgi:HlyD family secretion protein
MRAFLTLLVLAVISAGVFALGTLTKKGGDKPLLHVAAEVPLTVTVAQPAKEEIIRLVQAPGDVEAELEVEIRSEIMAKIEELPVDEGDAVKKGDLLARLNDKNLLADIESAKARIAQLQAAIVAGEADVEKAERDMTRQVSLSESDATSDLELRDCQTVRDKARANLQMRQHELAQAEAMLKRVQEDLEKTIIRSPIDGVISKLQAEIGSVVVTGTMNNPGTVVMTISDLSRMQVRARVDEVDVPLVQPGQPARVYLQSDQHKPVAAKVVRVAPKGVKTAGRDVVNFEAILEVISREDRVKPGMTANVEIEVARNDEAITIPIEAIVHRMRKDLPESIVAEFDQKQTGVEMSERVRQAQYIKVVYIKDGDKAKVRIVEPGISDARRVELRDGVSPTDTVITGPYRSLDQLRDGRAVDLLDKDKKKPEGDVGSQDETKTASKDEKKENADNNGAKEKGSKDESQTASAKP